MLQVSLIFWHTRQDSQNVQPQRECFPVAHFLFNSSHAHINVFLKCKEYPENPGPQLLALEGRFLFPRHFT